MPCVVEKSSLLVAYEDEIQKTADLYHVSFKDASMDVRRQIKIDAAKHIRPIAAWAYESAKQENSGESEYEIGAFRMDNGRFQYVDGVFDGQFLTDLDRRTKELTPHLFNPSDAAINQSIEERLNSGSHRVITVYPREGRDNRDIVVMEYDKEKNVGKISIINTATDGRYHTYGEIREIAKKRFSDSANQEKIVNTTFIFHDSPSETSDTKKIPLQRANQKSATHQITIERVIADGKQTMESAFKNTSTEITYTAKSIKKYWEKRMKEQPKKSDTISARNEHPIKNKRGEAIRNNNTVERVIRKGRRIALSLSLIEKTGIGIGASPVLIEALKKTIATREKHNKINHTKREKKLNHLMPKLHRYHNIHMNVSNGEKTNQKKSTLILRGLEKHKTKAVNKKYVLNGLYVLDTIKNKKKRETIELYIQTKKTHNEKRMTITKDAVHSRLLLDEKYITRSKKREIRLQRRLLRFLQLQATRVKIHETPSIQKKQNEKKEKRSRLQEKKISRQKQERAVMEKLAFCIAYILLIRGLHSSNSNYSYEQKEKSMRSLKKLVASTERVPKVAEVPPEEIESPWLLLSIIWYLTMIREQGMTHYSTQSSAMVAGKKKKLQMRTVWASAHHTIQSPALPISGVIFSYIRSQT